MTNERVSFELQLQALGRLLDRHPTTVKEICILQAGEGYVVNMLAATEAVGGPAFAPTTVVFEEPQLRSAIDELSSKKPTGWFRR
jgi:hypothetical protein